MTNETAQTAKAYNVNVIQLTEAETGVNAAGTEKIKFRASMTLRGKEVERTVIAQGKAAAAIAEGLGVSTQQSLRVLFENAPDNEDGTPGGQFLTVVGRPAPRKAA